MMPKWFENFLKDLTDEQRTSLHVYFDGTPHVACEVVDAIFNTAPKDSVYFGKCGEDVNVEKFDNNY